MRRKNGTGSIYPSGYVMLHTAESGKILEHIQIVENVLGKKLPENAVIHHVNEVKHDNRNENLVVCPSTSYHMLLHKRQKAYDTCGHADWNKCNVCKQYGPNDEVLTYGKAHFHKVCINTRTRENRLKRKLKKEV